MERLAGAFEQPLGQAFKRILLDAGVVDRLGDFDPARENVGDAASKFRQGVLGVRRSGEKDDKYGRRCDSNYDP